MRMTIVSAAIVAMSYHAVLSADLPSAEETVAFILYGVEDGRKIVQTDKVAATVSQTTKSPATYKIASSGAIALTEVNVKEVEKCQFRITTNEKSKPAYGETIDFNRLLNVAFVQGYGLLNFSGACAIKGDDGSCNPTTLIPAEMRTPPQRIQKAIAYMKTTYCSGSAF